FASDGIGSEQTRMGKSPPGSERVRIGWATLLIVACGHCGLSVMARASRPPGTYCTHRASSAAQEAVDIATINAPHKTARVVSCIPSPKPSAIFRANNTPAGAGDNHKAAFLEGCQTAAGAAATFVGTRQAEISRLWDLPARS